MDEVDSFNNDNQLSLREAIMATNANTDPNDSEEIWLPAWDFVLTRDRQTYGTGIEDMDASFGDLDIKDTLIIQGVKNQTSVRWRLGVTDAVFDLLGDFNQDGQTQQNVSGSDYLIWQQENGKADPTAAKSSLALMPMMMVLWILRTIIFGIYTTATR